MTTKTGVTLLSISALVLIAVLYFGNFAAKKETKSSSHAHQQMEQTLSFEDFENQQIASLTPELKTEAQQLKSNWENSKDNPSKIKSAHDAAHFWEAIVPELGAFYHYQSATLEKNVEQLVSIGDEMILHFRQTKNDEIRNTLITFALRSFEEAQKLNPNDNTLKLKTGTAYLEGSIEPMKGVALLKEVIEQEPENVQALILLGRFSIMSGQFDKAKERLDKALLIQPSNAEAIFFMAITQDGLGNKEKAIELFEICKKLVNNPDFNAEIDVYINELKSNKK
ncbi:MAG: tetratricopeptide repeat protein [Chitinophagales bacterium]|nr:tetratricopeptide repeat protein [Chitinophagales bacterium]MCZ2392954.1 tetratricopeptide repeat protein [Chitinophagales bacterium]